MHISPRVASPAYSLYIIPSSSSSFISNILKVKALNLLCFSSPFLVLQPGALDGLVINLQL